MQQTKRRSKKGLILLALAIALLVMAFVPTAMASPPAPNVLAPDISMSAWGNWAQGNHYWFGPDYDYVAADFGAVMNGDPQTAWTGIPIAAPYSGTLDVGSYKWSVNGMPVGQEVDPVGAYPTTQYFGDSDNSYFSWALASLPMNDGIYTLAASLKETTATANFNVQKATVTTDFGVDNTDPEWVHVAGINEACYYNIPVKFTALAQDPYGSGVAPTPTADWESLGNPVNTALGYQLDWDRYIYEVTGTVNPPPVPYAWNEVTNELHLYAEDMVGNDYDDYWDVNFDLVPPVTDYTVNPAGSDTQAGWTNKPVTVTFDAADGHPRPNSGVAYTEYIVKTTTTTAPPAVPGINESGTKGTSVVIDQTAPIGPSYVYFRSVDNACPTGNKEAWNLVRVFFDNVAPAMSDDTPEWWINKFPFLNIMDFASINITASDHNSGLASPGVTWAIEGHPPIGGAGMGPVIQVPILPLALGDGIRALTYTATDKAGNVATGGNDIKIDTRGPVTDGDAGWVNGLEPYVLTATDQASGSGVAATVYRVDQATPWSINEASPVGVTLETEITLSGTQGSTHTIDFASVDAALPFWFDADGWAAWTDAPAWHLGNWELDILNIAKTGAAYKSRTVQLDVTAPEVMLATPVQPDWQKVPATLNFTGTDVGSGYAFTEWSTDGGVTVNKGEVAQIGGNGVTTVNYRGVDKVGIRSEWKATTVSISTTRPSVTGGNVSVKKGKKATFHFNVTAVTPTATSVVIEIRTKAGRTVSSHRYANVLTNSDQTRSFRVNLKKGKYNIRISAVDAAGNIQAKRGGGTLRVK